MAKSTGKLWSFPLIARVSWTLSNQPLLTVSASPRANHSKWTLLWCLCSKMVSGVSEDIYLLLSVSRSPPLPLLLLVIVPTIVFLHTVSAGWGSKFLQRDMSFSITISFVFPSCLSQEIRRSSSSTISLLQTACLPFVSLPPKRDQDILLHHDCPGDSSDLLPRLSTCLCGSFLQPPHSVSPFSLALLVLPGSPRWYVWKSKLKDCYWAWCWCQTAVCVADILKTLVWEMTASR